MNQFKKGIIAMGLALILCMNTVMPVRAATGSVCPSCRGTNTEACGEITQSEFQDESCTHGYTKPVFDRVGYLVHYPRIFCHDCRELYLLEKEAKKEEKSRICSFA